MFIQLSPHRQSNIRRTNTSITLRLYKQTQKVISYFVYNGQIQKEEWYKNGKYHRIGGAPAIILYYENGRIRDKSWYKNGELHRPGGAPAVILYYENGEILDKSWFKDGKRH